MPDTEFWTNPVLITLGSNVITAAVTALGVIYSSRINKSKSTTDEKIDVQKMVNDSFKVLIDSYEKQLSTLNAKVVAQDSTILSLNDIVREQETTIRTLSEKVDDQENTIESLQTLVHKKKTRG